VLAVRSAEASTMTHEDHVFILEKIKALQDAVIELQAHVVRINDLLLKLVPHRDPMD
jgi:hypothetical protein